MIRLIAAAREAFAKHARAREAEQQQVAIDNVFARLPVLVRRNHEGASLDVQFGGTS